MEEREGEVSPPPPAAPVENGESHGPVTTTAAAGPVENGGSHGPAAGERRYENPGQGGEVLTATEAAAATPEPMATAPPPAAAVPAPMATAPAPATAVPAPAGVVLAVPAAAAEGVSAAAAGMKKKRGRPRKYGPDGRLARPLNPLPISASMPVGKYTPATAVGAVMKRGTARPMGFGLGKSPQYGFLLEPAGDMVACSDFTVHILTVAAGEDVSMKIMSFSHLGPRAICILSAHGIISNVTLRQPDSFGGTLTYEGHFQLLSLSGSFMPTENGGTRSRSGGMSVSLVSEDGRIVGGGVAGLLVAASPVQVVVGSFLPSYHLEQKTKKTKLETAPISTPTAAVPISSRETEGAYCSGQMHCSSITPKSNLTPSSSFRVENWPAPLQSVPDMKNTKTSIDLTAPGN